MRASWKLKRIIEHQDPASRYLMIRADLAEKRALEEMNGVDRLLFVPPNTAAPHPDSCPIEPTFLFTLANGGKVEEYEGPQTIVSEGQFIPVGVDDSDAPDAGPSSRYGIAYPNMHPDLKDIYSRVHSYEIEPVDWVHYCDNYEPAKTEEHARLSAVTDGA